MINPYQLPEQDSHGDVNVVGLLVGFLAFGMILFAILSIYGFNVAHKATTTLNTQKAAAAKVARDAQKKSDAKAELTANESPYRSYTAPGDFGSFVIYFPKDWSGYAITSTQDQIQVNLALNPNFITETNDDQEDPVATRVELIQQLPQALLQQYTGLIDLGKLKQQSITVSGIKGTELTGPFSDGKTIASVFLQVRGQTMVISCENSTYLPEYNIILSQAKIYP